MNKTLQIINEWDPMDFLSHAPDDEYEEEAKLVDELLEQTKNVHELANGIKIIFIRMFGDDFKKDYEECLQIAYKLLANNPN